jgi:8-oxo-dGTP pyrophosphatase MutT (NUDIX family)
MSVAPIPVTAAGGIVIRMVDGQVKLLLMFRRGEWDLPKGKLDAGETIEQCAIREVSEETGVTGLRISQFLTQTHHEYEDEYGFWSKTTHWYLMSMEGDSCDLVPQSEEGIEQLEWVSLDEAQQRIRFESLSQVLAETKKATRG